MEELKNSIMKIFSLVFIVLVINLSCKESKENIDVINIAGIDTTYKDISNFSIGEFKYCDFIKLDKFKKIHPKVSYCKIDSITDEILYENDKILISQPYRFGYDNKERVVSLNNERLVVKRVFVNQDENNGWYTFSKILIDYVSSDGYYSSGNYFIIINQPNGLSGKANIIHFVQFINKKNKIYYEFFANDDLTLNYDCL